VPNVTEPYTVSQQLLNQALLNITMSVITDFRLWNATDTEIQQRMTINVYSFSKPLNLLIPYFVSLFLALPILAIGGFALRQNGVSAVDGGFIQVRHFLPFNSQSQWRRRRQKRRDNLASLASS
jgi:hypothetical protein